MTLLFVFPCSECFWGQWFQAIDTGDSTGQQAGAECESIRATMLKGKEQVANALLITLFI